MKLPLTTWKRTKVIKSPCESLNYMTYFFSDNIVEIRNELEGLANEVNPLNVPQMQCGENSMINNIGSIQANEIQEPHCSKQNLLKLMSEKGNLNIDYCKFCNRKEPLVPTKDFCRSCGSSGRDCKYCMRRKCNWCGFCKILLPSKPFCHKCSTVGRECSHCHRPMPDRFYLLSEKTCNACFKKHAKQREKRLKRSQEKRQYQSLKFIS